MPRLPRTDRDIGILPVLSHAEVGALMGLKPRRVGFIEAKALAKLRGLISAAGLTFDDLRFQEPRVRVREETF